MKRRARILLGGLLIVTRATTVLATPADRVAYVDRALAAVRSLGPSGRDKLDRELFAAARAHCEADHATPSAPCLVDTARALCAKDANCEAAADVISANLRSVTDFVDEQTRVHLLRGAADYHTALAAELRKRYGMLAAELVLAGGIGNQATAIDQMCRERDAAIHACAAGAAACVPSLPWSRCIAAVIWFIGSEP